MGCYVPQGNSKPQILYPTFLLVEIPPYNDPKVQVSLAVSGFANHGFGYSYGEIWWDLTPYLIVSLDLLFAVLLVTFMKFWNVISRIVKEIGKPHFKPTQQYICAMVMPRMFSFE